ncbi:undecaprenyl-phosphate glucose phosphotransferase [Pusillimonas sp. TS35]|nr:undecaprenyl-phosphate glucose phosphotransferase [Pusillimonas sp. TS35]
MNRPPHYIPTLAERYPIAFAAGVVDFLLIISGGYLGHYIRFGDFFLFDNYVTANLVIALTVVLCQVLVGNYLSWRGRSFPRQLGRVYLGWLLAIAVITGLAVFLKVSTHYSRLWLLTSLAISVGLTTLFRLFMFLVLRKMRARGRNLKHVLLVESGRAAAALRARWPTLREQGYNVVKTMPLEHTEDWLRQIAGEVVRSGVHEVWLCLPLQEGEAIKTIMHALRHHTVDIRYVPDLGDLPLLNHRVSEIAGLYTLDISRSPMEGPARLLKRTEDLVLGGLISLIALPVCIVIAIAIKITSRGPVVFKQYRTGINGRRFKVYKFRSMEVHEESSGQVTQAHFGDPRVTKLGAFLRRTSLDELPQFYNVLQGRMSIVGPRPHAIAHNEHYKDMVESYMQRHKVKPGITGWAQVNGYRGQTDTLDKMAKRVEHDLWYIDNWSLWLDMKIIVMTVYKGFVNGQP